MLGGLFALLSAATFALNQASTRRGVLTGTVLQALCVTVPMGVPLFLIIAFAIGHAGDIFTFNAMSVMWLSLAGINHFLAGRFFNYWGVQAAGSNITGTVQQLDIVVSLGLAIWLLGEYLTPLRVAGIVLILGSPLLTLRSDIKAARGESGPLKFTPQLGRGYAGAILAGICYGISPILVRAGLQDASPGASMAAGVISYFAASVVLLLIVILLGRGKEAVSTDRKALPWFAFAGLSVGAAQVFRYAALAMVPVAVVAPILRTTLVFRLFFSWWLNRDHEIFSKGIVLTTFLSLLGALLLSMSTDLFLSLVPVPAWMETIIRMRWP